MRNTKRILLILLCSILFFLPVFFHSIRTPTSTSVTIIQYQEIFPESNRSNSRVSNISEEQKLIIFSKSQYFNQTYKPSENVICYLVASYVGEIRFAENPYPRLRERVLQLDERLGDGNLTDVIIFHTGYPSRTDLLAIIESSHRHVQFVNIDRIFYKFSPNFHPHIQDSTWSKRGKWNYHHMCYFWFKQIFELNIIRKYRYMMRLDDDSQLQGKWPNIFDLLNQQQAIYLANQREVDYDYILPGIVRIRNVTLDYIAKHNLTVQNRLMFDDIFQKPIEIPNYWNNIEIVDLAFFRRKEILDFTRAIDESHGIFLYRWGDAPLRYVTLALFANASQVLHRTKLGLGYCHPC